MNNGLRSSLLRWKQCAPVAPTVIGMLVLCIAPDALASVSAGELGPPAGGLRGWIAEVFGKIRSPWFWFGMTAQFVFFMRFVIQWIASEKKRRSTVPVAFWYLSLVGSLALFVYAIHERDPVIMAGQLLACVIYIRNLMLISDWKQRRRQAGLPTDDPDAEEVTTASSAPAGAKTGSTAVHESRIAT